jgi:predicted transcriptional regulator
VRKKSNNELGLSSSQFERLISEIHSLVRVFAANQIDAAKGTEKNARYLKVFGFSEQEIADLLGVSQPAVNLAISRSKNKRKQTKKRTASG